MQNLAKVPFYAFYCIHYCTKLLFCAINISHFIDTLLKMSIKCISNTEHKKSCSQIQTTAVKKETLERHYENT